MATAEARITSSELARRGGIGVQSIRFYEREGLLPRPPRSAAGYRLFCADDVRRVRFIKRAQELGFSLREIKQLLALRVDPQTSCADLRQRAEQKRRDIAQRITDLRRIQRALQRLAVACPGRGPAEQCPILASLDPASAAP